VINLAHFSIIRLSITYSIHLELLLKFRRNPQAINTICQRQIIDSRAYQLEDGMRSLLPGPRQSPPCRPWYSCVRYWAQSACELRERPGAERWSTRSVLSKKLFPQNLDPESPGKSFGDNHPPSDPVPELSAGARGVFCQKNFSPRIWIQNHQEKVFVTTPIRPRPRSARVPELSVQEARVEFWKKTISPESRVRISRKKFCGRILLSRPGAVPAEREVQPPTKISGP
jgi:hypothetical protein